MTLDQLLALRIRQIYLEAFPLDQILTDSLYYPNCGLDGEIIRCCNTLFDQFEICSFVLADRNVTESQFLDGMDNFSHYKIMGTRDVVNSTQLDQPVFFHPNHRHFARWTVYQRIPGFGREVGPERFSLLFFGGVGVSDADVYDELYHNRRVTPKAIVGDSHLNDENDPYTVTLCSRNLPELIFYKAQNEDDELNMDPIYDYECDADVHFGPGGRGNVTIWRMPPDVDER